LFPVLGRLLARAQVQGAPAVGRDYERALFALFHGEWPSEADPPVAAVTRYLDSGQRDAGWYLRADPVHLRADLHKLILFDADAFTLARDEAEALAAEAGRFLGGAGARLEALMPGRWYLGLAEAPRLRTHSLYSVVGRDLSPYLPHGEQGPQWRGILNELQMLLHASPVNQAREARGELPVNSLWFWGGGRLPRVQAGCWEQVWSDDPLALGLAKLAQIPRSARPGTGADWLAQAVTPGRHLVVLDSLYRSARYADVEDWLMELGELERHWFVLLSDALRRRRLASLTLLGGEGGVYRATPGSLRRWWRRPRPFSQYLV